MRTVTLNRWVLEGSEAVRVVMPRAIDEEPLAQLVAALEQRGVFCSSVSITRRSTETDLFHDLNAALQSPYATIGNWNALSDVLGDLSWIPNRCVLLIAYFDGFVTELALTLLRCLCDASEHLLSMGIRLASLIVLRERAEAEFAT